MWTATFGDVFVEDDERINTIAVSTLRSEADFKRRASDVYQLFAGQYNRRFRWLNSHHFGAGLHKDLVADSNVLRAMLGEFGEWDSAPRY